MTPSARIVALENDNTTLRAQVANHEQRIFLIEAQLAEVLENLSAITGDEPEPAPYDGSLDIRLVEDTDEDNQHFAEMARDEDRPPTADGTSPQGQHIVANYMFRNIYGDTT